MGFGFTPLTSVNGGSYITNYFQQYPTVSTEFTFQLCPIDDGQLWIGYYNAMLCGLRLPVCARTVPELLVDPSVRYDVHQRVHQCDKCAGRGQVGLWHVRVVRSRVCHLRLGHHCIAGTVGGVQCIHSSSACRLVLPVGLWYDERSDESHQHQLRLLPAAHRRRPRHSQCTAADARTATRHQLELY